MNDRDDDIASEWDDDAATTVYDEGMLDEARAALGMDAEASEEEPPDEWFVSEDGKTKQSLSAAEVIERCRAGELSEETLVWYDGLDDWTPLAGVPELKHVFGALGSAPRNVKPTLPRVAKPPARGRLPAPSLPAPPPAPARPPQRPASKPTPVAPSYDSDATQVYESASVDQLRQQALPSDRARALSPAPAPQVTASQDTAPQDPPPAKAPKTVAEVPVAKARAAALAASPSLAGDWPDADAGEKKTRLIIVVAAFGVFAAIGAFTFGGESKPSLEGLPTQDYDLDAARAASDGAAAAPAEQAAAPQPASPDVPAEEPPTTGEEPAEFIDDGAEGEPSGDIAAAMAQALADGTAGAQAFNKAAARQAMAQAATQAKGCLSTGGPEGTGTIRVRIQPSGKVSSATVMTKKFASKSPAECISQIFMKASVPAFKGKAKTVDQRFTIP